MSWVVVVLFLLPVVAFAVFTRRVARIARLLRDPQQLRSLLSSHVRTALVEAGLDPDSVTIEEIQESEELRRLVAADLRRVLGGAIFGLRLPQSGVATSAAPGRSRHDFLVEPLPLHMRGSPRTHEPGRPPPIDQPSGLPLRAILIAVIVGIVAVAIFLSSQR